MSDVAKFKEFEFHGNQLGTPVVTMQYIGVFDMQGVFEAVADFFRQHKFKFHEKMQRHRRAGPFGVEREYKLVGERAMDEYYEWSITVKMETFDERDIEVVDRKGEKKTMTKGRLWIQIWGSVTLDYEKKWEKSFFTIHLRKFYNKYVIKKRIEFLMWDKLYYNGVLKMHAAINQKLKMMSKGTEHRYGGGRHG